MKSVHAGLIFGHLISLAAITFWNMLDLMKKFQFSLISQKKMKSNFKKYIDFLKFSTLSNLFNSLSNIGMTSLIIIFFGAKIAGLYFLAEKLIAIPISFITNSVSQVYFEKASKLFYSDKLELIRLTNKIQKNIFFILCPFLILMSVLGENIFSILGEEWTEAGVILKYFTVFILLKNIYSPISHIGDILNKQKVLLIFNVSLFLFQLCSFYFLKEYADIKLALLTASFFGAIHYLMLNIYMKKELIKLS
jgi:O-antigen/teichoic acid export membrane protein